MDLDSTDETSIWQVDGVPRLYTAPKTDSGDCCLGCKECVLEKAEDVLLRMGIIPRREFSDNQEHWHVHHDDYVVMCMGFLYHRFPHITVNPSIDLES